MPTPKPFAEMTAAEIEKSEREVGAIAERAYVAYSASSGNQNFQGNPMPIWAALPPAIRAHWRAAVTEVIETL